jgi:hypothetical protein
MASNHRWRLRTSSYSRALCTAMPAAAASARSTISSSSVKPEPVFFSVR